eukprot:Sspe_Gene.107608::Locus_85868_Transcript_1_1_Confidence_1.000_Length_1178::g.107608::m.107608/K01517/ADPRM; manganese-dependent ADP-ribose/CDP-alcohol diphosphatase
MRASRALLALAVYTGAVLLFISHGLVRSHTARDSGESVWGEDEDEEPVPPSPDRVSIGVITDLQYADIPDGTDYTGTIARYYRRSLTILERAVQHWNRHREIRHVVNLGDTIDGANHRLHTTHTAVKRIRRLMDWSVGKQWVSAVGNHDLYNFPGVGLSEITSSSLPLAVELSNHFRLLMLDSYRVSVLTTKHYDTARRLLMHHNPNLRQGNMTPGAAVWLANLSGVQRRYTPLNGGIGSEQLRWLRDQLALSHALGKRTVISGHIPMHPQAALEENLLWDYPQVLRTVHAFRGTVAAVLSGHDHSGGAAIDEAGIPHITFPSPLEANKSFSDCFAIIHLNATHVDVEGFGRVPSQTFRIPSPSP